MLILIPAYEPDLRLVTLIRDLGHHLPDARVLVVDDGSGAAFDGVFEVSVDAGATVVRLPHNRGKGAALKVGFAWAAEHSPGDARGESPSHPHPVTSPNPRSDRPR